MYLKDLEYIGLSEKEARIYQALLKMTRSSAVELSRKTSMKQPTVYVIIEALKNKRLVKEVMVGKRPYYEAETPDSLRDLVAEEKMLMDRKVEKLESIVAALKTIDKEAGEKPVVRFYEGRESFKRAVEEFTKTQSFSEGMDYGVYSYELLDRMFSKQELKKIDQARVSSNSTFRAIYSGAAKYIQPESSGQELIKIDQEQFPIECDIGIFNDEVRISTLGIVPSGIFIKNKAIATTLKSLINYVFSQKNR
ncbi:MAG: hypothetical protein RJB39_247 [Candidatus Parcubacteria bacterium]|jgi:sugar-specific transcriptional regulator TrmB